MTNVDELLLGVLREAAEPGDALAPFGLLLAVAGHSDPIRALSDIDQANALFKAFAKEFGFVRSARIPGKPLDIEDRKRLIALIRWLIRELSQWRDHDDLQRCKLVALFVVTQSCDLGDVFWSGLPDGPGENAELGATLEKMISTSKIEFRSRGRGPVPIWEEESVDALKQADEQGNWVEIAEKWHLFENALFPNVLQVQMVRYLYRFGFDRIVRAVDNVHQTPVAMYIAAVLSTEQRLHLANSSNNPRVQFSCVHQTLSTHPKPAQLLPREQQLLTKLLLKIANESSRWDAWMRVFNSYPLRYPALQVPLGRALATAPIAALKTYVDSINLHATTAKPEGSRRCVAECLREFKETAIAEHRKFVWTYAHERWLTWRFDQASRDSYLFGINWSQLDYALVAYAVECMDEDAREKTKEAISSELGLVETTWHESLSCCLTQWNCLLSQFQPFARADYAIQSGEDWLTETRTYRPSASVSDYLTMMFRIN